MDRDGNVFCNPCNRSHKGYMKLKNVSPGDIICAKAIDKRIRKSEYICINCSKNLAFPKTKITKKKKSVKK